MLFAVIDTNILVSALLKFDSIPGLVVEQIFRGNITPVLHDDIVDEYRGVLSREKFAFNPYSINALINRLLYRGIFVEPAEVDIYLPDAKDEIFYTTALTARECIDNDAQIITGNMKHFPNVSFAVTPREALNLLLQRG
ncbi:MAG: PIN domain-containing protein [Synergistaceae bacterium]|nr:PIN domain-containing protein [Synergistaceae bacterium]